VHGQLTTLEAPGLRSPSSIVREIEKHASFMSTHRDLLPLRATHGRCP